MLAELQDTDSAGNEQSCSEAESDTDSEIFSPLPCYRRTKLSETTEAVQSDDVSTDFESNFKENIDTGRVDVSE